MLLTAVTAVVGLAVGCVAGSVGHLIPIPADYPHLVEFVPLPHHVPSHQGGASFRFAMAHDVLHERFPKHGPAYHRERERLTRAKLAKLAADDPQSFPLADDLAAALDALGKPEEAVAVIRDKLARQLAKGYAGKILYTSHANLGTLLTHASYRKAAAGDEEGRKQFREGVERIQRAVDLNPGAHFGREQWQAAFAEWLLAAMEKPDLLKKFDCLGNRLDLEIRVILDREINWPQTAYGRATNAEFSQWRVSSDRMEVFLSGEPLDEPARWHDLQPIREHITRVGAEYDWEAVKVPSHRKPVAFDEPMLGIIGMWRQGEEANPHFALAIGETMLRVGQRYIAWTAYERASRMADQFWPDPPLQQMLRDHCRQRQEQIETTLRHRPARESRRYVWQHVSPPPEEETVAQMRSRFEAELAHGEDYQRAYQRYETEKIAAGVPITEETFYDAFHKGRDPIASPVGAEEWFAHVPRAKMREYASRRRWTWGLLGAGIAAMAMALLQRWRG
jgi:hypothetical protein